MDDAEGCDHATISMSTGTERHSKSKGRSRTGMNGTGTAHAIEQEKYGSSGHNGADKANRMGQEQIESGTMMMMMIRGMGRGGDVGRCQESKR